jgi:hypothetical protein
MVSSSQWHKLAKDWYVHDIKQDVLGYVGKVGPELNIRIGQDAASTEESMNSRKMSGEPSLFTAEEMFVSDHEEHGRDNLINHALTGQLLLISTSREQAAKLSQSRAIMSYPSSWVSPDRSRNRETRIR